MYHYIIISLWSGKAVYVRTTVVRCFILIQVHISHQSSARKLPRPPLHASRASCHSAEDIQRISYKQSTHRTDRPGRCAGGSQYLMDVVTPPSLIHSIAAELCRSLPHTDAKGRFAPLLSRHTCHVMLSRRWLAVPLPQPCGPAAQLSHLNCAAFMRSRGHICLITNNAMPFIPPAHRLCGGEPSHSSHGRPRT